MKLQHKPNKIILHTAAYRGAANAELIRRWHLEQGWEDIGYHYVIVGSVFDQTAQIEKGRNLCYQGAHAFGSNRNSIGICVTGHGDHIEWTAKQLELLTTLIHDLMGIYSIKVKDVIGHRETWYQKLKKIKTCPGTLIDMNEIRKILIDPGTIFGELYDIL